MRMLFVTLMVVLFAVALSPALILPALADDLDPFTPPSYGGYNEGWGECPINWNRTSGSFNSGLCIWDPDIPGGAGGNHWAQFNGYTQTLLQYAPIVIELWVEMNAIQTYQYTHYEFHRTGAGPAETVNFVIGGTVSSNEDLWVGLTGGLDPMTQLTQQYHFGFGNFTDAIPLTWEGRWGDGLAIGNSPVWPDNAGNWASMTVSDNDLFFPTQIPVCDHWFQFRGWFDLPYHIDDGYYSLTIAGCPAPTL